MKKNLKKILKILKKHRRELKEDLGITKIKIFGSYVKGKQKKTSDLDLIVDFKETPGLLRLIEIEEKLSKLLRIKVDLLTEEEISPYIRESIEKEKVVLL